VAKDARLSFKEGTIQVRGSDMHYVAFGKGTTPLVIIPGKSACGFFQHSIRSS